MQQKVLFDGFDKIFHTVCSTCNHKSEQEDGMAYDQELAGELEDFIEGDNRFTVKKMFGGLGFLMHGNMCFGVYQDYLILRLGKENTEMAAAGNGIR